MLNTLLDLEEALQMCAPTVHVATMRRLVSVESGSNQFAIGVVGAKLQRQPSNYHEALATIRWLDANGYDYSVGLAQVNKRNFKAYGLTAESALMTCPNLAAGAAILTECFRRASSHAVAPQTALRAAFSCYESGNFSTGYRDGYVHKIVAQPTTVPTARGKNPTGPFAQNPVSSAQVERP